MKFDIWLPVFRVRSTFYIGKAEWERFVKDVVKQGGSVDLTIDSVGGVVSGSTVYISAPEDFMIVSHELCHLVTNIVEDRRVNNDDETRAYITGYITEKFYERVETKKKKEPILDDPKED